MVSRSNMQEHVFSVVHLISRPEPEALIQWLRTQDSIPALSYLYGVAERLDYHPEGDSGIHLEMAVRQAWIHCGTPEERTAVLLHDIGKAVTGRAIENPTEFELGPPKFDLNGILVPTHHGHDRIGATMMRGVFEQLNLPLDWLPLAEVVADFHQRLHAISSSSANAIVSFIEQIHERIPMKSRTDAVESFVRCVRSDFNGRLGFEERNYDQGDVLINAERAITCYEQDNQERERINRVIESRKQEIFKEFSRSRPDVLVHLTWRDTMIELRNLQVSGDLPPVPQSLYSYVSEQLLSSNSSSSSRRLLKP